MHDPIPFTIELDYITFSGWRWGKGNPSTVLALHGWLDNCASFSRIASELALSCGLDIWAIDLAGHGHSGHRPKGSYYHIWDNVIDLALIMDAQGWDKVSLLGHSMGAGIATLMAGALPERIDKVALLEGIGPIVTPPADSPAQLASALKRFQLHSYKKAPAYQSVREAAEARMKGISAISYDAAFPLAERGLKEEKDTLLWRSDSRLRIPSPVRFTEDQVNHFCSAIEAPTCLLIAENGFLANRDNTRTRSSQVQQLLFRTLPGNHHFHLEPDTCKQVTGELVSFWNV